MVLKFNSHINQTHWQMNCPITHYGAAHEAASHKTHQPVRTGDRLRIELDDSFLHQLMDLFHFSLSIIRI